MKRLRYFKHRSAAALGGAVALLWILGPGDEETGRIVHMLPRGLLTALVVAAIAAGLGERLLGWLRLRPPGRAQLVVYAVGTGMGLLSLAIMALALCHALSRHTVMALLVALSLLSPPREAAKAAWTGLLDTARRRYDSIGMGIALGVLVVMGVSFLALGVCPPVDTDSLRYHLRLPELYLETHTFQYPVRNHFAHFPLAAEMLYAIGLACAGSTGANLVGVIAGLTCLLAIYALGARHFSPAVGVSAAAIFATTPLVGCLFGTALVDLFVCLYVVLGVGAVMNCQAGGGSRWLLLAGLCGGMAAAAKLGGAFSAALMAVWAGLVGPGTRKGSATRFLAVAVPAALVLAPWIIKTTLVTGNPLFPLFPELLGGRDWRPEYTDNYLREVHSYGRFGGSLSDYVLSPVWITVSWKQYGSPVPVGPLYLVMLLGLPLMGPRGKPVWRLAAWCGGFTVMWLFTAQVARFILPGLAAFAVVAGFVGVRSARAKEERPLFVPIHLSLMILAVAAWACVAQWTHFEPWPYLSARMTQAQYIAKHADYYPVVLHANRSLPRDSRILFVGETLSYKLRRPALVETGFAGVSVVDWANQTDTASQLAQVVRDAGFTHVLLDKKAPGEYWAKKLHYFAWRDVGARRRFEDVVNRFATPLYAHGGVCLYELHPPGGKGDNR